jgi:PHD/YefM family antitoxin component YafN of YafNO toxin-antitoxin module
MPDLSNSHSLTDFQRNARAFIEDLNQTQEPVLLTVNGKVQAILVDPKSFQEMERSLEKERFFDAIKEGERAVQEGRTVAAKKAYTQMKRKYGL